MQIILEPLAPPESCNQGDADHVWNENQFGQPMATASISRAAVNCRSAQCRYCQVTFSSASDRVRHERTHTGERPFRCDQCRMSFKRKDHLSLHLRSHTGERPFACRLCSKTFTRANRMRWHACKGNRNDTHSPAC
ncbi:uncharacterized protein LOC144106833 isoform X2 [Amblyomma americanum]